MIRKLKAVGLSLFFALTIFWVSFQMPCTQQAIRDAAASIGEKNGLNISFKSLEITLPFCFHCTDLSISTTAGAPILSSSSVEFTPVLLDIPWHRCTLLYLHAQDLSINLNNLPSTTAHSAENSSWTFSALYFSFPSLSCTGSHLPNTTVDIALAGRASIESNGNQASIDIQLSHNNPIAWPKKFNLEAIKQGALVTFNGSCALQGVANDFLFSPDDYLSFCGECSMNQSSQNFLKNASCKWALASKSLKHSISSGICLEHSFQIQGSLSYDENTCISGSIDTGLVQIATQKPLFDSSSLSLKQQKLSLKGQFAASFLNNGSFRFEMSLPECCINGCPGSFSASADVDSSEKMEKNLKAILSGSITSANRTIPILGILTASLGGDTPISDCTITSSPFVAAFHFQRNEAETSMISTIRCLNLSTLLPDCTKGEAELFIQTATKGGKIPLTLTLRTSDLSLHNIELQNGTFACSTSDISQEAWSIRTDCSGFQRENSSITKAQSTLNFAPATHTLTIQELTLLGKHNELPFNLLASGKILLQPKNFSCCIDTLEGTLDKEAIKLIRPIQFELKNSALVNAGASVRIGEQCLITGQWQQPSYEIGLSDITVERLPVRLLFLALNKPISSGITSGFLRFKKTAGDISAKMHLDASKVRYGVIGAEGSELAIGLDAQIENGALTASLCTAGVGIKDPLFAEGKISITHTKSAPFFTIDPTNTIQGSLRGSLSISEFLTNWVSKNIHIDGTILGDLTISGSLSNPSFHGPVSLRKGRIEIPPTAQVLNNIEMDGTASDKTICVESIRADDEKEGRIQGRGSIGINEEDKFFWNTDLTCSQLEAVSLAYAKAIADGKVHLQGDCSSLNIIGNPIAKHSIIDLAARFPNAIPEMNIIYKDEHPIPKKTYTVTLHLGIDGQNGLMIRGKGLSSIWKGNVLIDGEAESLKMQGILRCTEGSFALGSKELHITEGTISVHGNLFTDSKLHIIATINLPDVVASVSVTGSLAAPKLAIQSTPMKPENEILSLVLFNKEYGDISPFESLQLAQTALQLRQTSSPFDFIDKMKERLGIDVLDVNTSNLQPSPSLSGALDPSDAVPLASQAQNEVSLRVGKYVSQGIAVVVSKDVTSDTNRLGVEAHVAKEVTAAAEIGDDESGVVSLKWKKDY